MISDEDRRRTAYHEGGHAIVGMLTPGADPVRKVSIIPRGMALGVTFSAPDADRFNYLEPEILARIKVALGGRVAEEIVFGETSTGAESDIEQLTRLARQMVGRWGMSDALGPVSVIARDGSGPFLPGVPEVAPETQRLVDEEVRRIVVQAHAEVLALLTENRPRLDSLATALLAHETLDETEAYSAAGVSRPPATLVGELAAAVRSRT
jgi:cell division protease FtsH